MCEYEENIKATARRERDTYPVGTTIVQKLYNEAHFVKISKTKWVYLISGQMRSLSCDEIGKMVRDSIWEGTDNSFEIRMPTHVTVNQMDQNGSAHPPFVTEMSTGFERGRLE